MIKFWWITFHIISFIIIFGFKQFLGRCQGAIPPAQFEEQQHQIFSSDQKRQTSIKSVHEELALQWVVATGSVRRDAASNNSRFIIFLIIIFYFFISSSYYSIYKIICYVIGSFLMLLLKVWLFH